MRAVQSVKDEKENLFGLALYPLKNGGGEACVEAAGATSTMRGRAWTTRRA